MFVSTPSHTPLSSDFIFLIVTVTHVPMATGSTYPLDLVRSRLSIATASIALAAGTSSSSSSSSAPARIPAGALPKPALFHTTAVAGTVAAVYSKADLTIWGMTMKIMREEGGVRGLYRGLVTTAVGVAPYVGINFASYELLRSIITPPGKNDVLRKLSCGALAGGCFRSHWLWFVSELVFRDDIADVDIPL